MSKRVPSILFLLATPLIMWSAVGDKFTASSTEGVAISFTVYNETEKTAWVSPNAVKTREIWQALWHNHIVGFLIVVVDATCQAFAEEREVKTYIICLCFLPLQYRVGQAIHHQVFHVDGQ